MRVLKNKLFNRWVKDTGLKDTELKKAIDEMNRGLFEANLGGNVYKKRISLGNRGKRSGARTIVAFKKDEIAIFIYGFAKNQQDSTSVKEEEALKALTKIYFNYSEDQIIQAVNVGELIEVKS